MPTEDAYSSGHLVLSHFGTCKCSNGETNISWTCLVSGLLSFEQPSVLLFLLGEYYDIQIAIDEMRLKIFKHIYILYFHFWWNFFGYIVGYVYIYIIYLFIFTIKVVPWRDWLERQPHKQEVVGSSLWARIFHCNSSFLCVPHSLTKRLRMKSSTPYT